MKIGTSANYPWFGPAFTELAQHTEALGFESMWTGEHIVIPANIADPQRYGVPLPENYRHMPDPFVTMAAAAAVTETLVFGMDICLVSQRNPLVLAKEVATLDRIARGRFVLGVGHGWIEEESEIMGAPYRLRVKMATEAVQALKTLWTEEVASFSGDYYNFPPLHSNPKPWQKPHPPVLLGSGNDKTDNTRALKRVAAIADGWLPSMLSPLQVREQLAQLREYCAQAGRDASAMDISLLVPAAYINIGERPPWALETSLGDARDLLPAYAEAGVTRLILGLDDMTDDTAFKRIEQAAVALTLV
ncbi:TIGR03619 family F420-dependent LLM class oxidoreductase [Haliea sp. E17]|uniref:TIGR03619 family F420-dependent LLM class oxidoreductase n=1 Tax=Haliea sp. E17 TaxID=3401576 RepID=UPI003AAAE722